MLPKPYHYAMKLTTTSPTFPFPKHMHSIATLRYTFTHKISFNNKDERIGKEK